MVLRPFERAADIDTPGGAVRNRLIEGKLAGQVIAAGVASQSGAEVLADADGKPFAEGVLDLAVSALSLHFATISRRAEYSRSGVH